MTIKKVIVGFLLFLFGLTCALSNNVNAQSSEIVSCSYANNQVSISLNNPSTAMWWDTNQKMTVSGYTGPIVYDTFGYGILPGQKVTINFSKNSLGSIAGTFRSQDSSKWLSINPSISQSCGTIVAGRVNLASGSEVENTVSALNAQLGPTMPTTYGIVHRNVFGPNKISQAEVSVSNGKVTVNLPPGTESSAWHWMPGDFAIGRYYEGNPSLQNTSQFLQAKSGGGFLMLVLTNKGWKTIPLALAGRTISGSLPEGAQSFGVIAIGIKNSNGVPGHAWLQVGQAKTSGTTAQEYKSGGWVDPTTGVGWAFQLN